MEFKITLDDTGLSGSADPVAARRQELDALDPREAAAQQLKVEQQMAELRALEQDFKGRVEDAIREMDPDREDRRLREVAEARAGRVGPPMAEFDEAGEARRQFDEERQAHARRMERLQARGEIDGAAEILAQEQLDLQETQRDLQKRINETMAALAPLHERVKEQLASETNTRRLRMAEEDERFRQQGAEGVARRQMQDEERARERARAVRQARYDMDPDLATAADAQAAGGLLGRLGGRSTAQTVLQNAGQLSQLPEAVAGLGQAGGLEAAAGPFGAALAVAQAAGKEWAQSIDAWRQKIEFAGDVAKDLAQNNPMATFNRSVDAASSGLSKIPIVGEGLGNALQLAVQPVRSFTDVVGAFVDRGRQLQGLSGPLATATAFADFRSQLADLREADELGPALASLTDAQSRISNEFRELLLPIKRFVAEVLASILNEMADHVREIRYVLTGIKEVLLDVAEKFFAVLGNVIPQAGEVVKAIQAIRKALTQDKDAQAVGLDSVLAALNGRNVPGVPLNPRRPNGLNIPGLNGGF